MTIVGTQSEGTRYGLVDIPGRIDSQPSIIGPVSRRPCVIWELTLFAEHISEDGPYYEPIWVAGRSGDLVLSWEESRGGRDPPRTGCPRPP
jgi:hypothetical protein